MQYRSFVKVAAAALVCSAGAFSSQDTLAGQKNTSTVSITLGSPFEYDHATGTLGSARNSTDSVQKISCSSWFDGTNDGGNCSAKNAAGTVLTCTTTDPDYIAQIRSISGQTFVRFYAGSSGSCIGLTVSQSSINDVPVN
jgi:hypothetical protein